MNSGIYLITVKSTGDSYVGATTDLNARLHAQLRYEMRMRMNSKHFPGRTWISARKHYKIPLADFEVRILEFVPCGSARAGRHGNNLHLSSDLRRREVFWIRELNPSLNSQLKGAMIDFSDIPVGPPPSLGLHLASA